jgi:hypothetical protein
MGSDPLRPSRDSRHAASPPFNRGHPDASVRAMSALAQFSNAQQRRSALLVLVAVPMLSLSRAPARLPESDAGQTLTQRHESFEFASMLVCGAIAEHWPFFAWCAHGGRRRGTARPC